MDIICVEIVKKNVIKEKKTNFNSCMLLRFIIKNCEFQLLFTNDFSSIYAYGNLLNGVKLSWRFSFHLFDQNCYSVT